MAHIESAQRDLPGVGKSEIGEEYLILVVIDILPASSQVQHETIVEREISRKAYHGRVIAINRGPAASPVQA
jgi:hypothetical protein